MNSVLVINNGNIDKSILLDALDTFKKIKLKHAESVEEAIKLSHERYFEIIFLDFHLDSIDYASKFKLANPETIVVCVFEELDDALEEKVFKSGVRDCLRSTIDFRLTTQRISNYLELAQLKKERLFHSEAINLFTKNIYQRYLIFKLNSNTAKVEFWDYFSDDYFKKYQNIEETMYVLYAFASWMFLNNRDCEVIKETSKETIYLTLQPIDSIDKKIINTIMNKYSYQVDYKLENHKLSMQLQAKTQTDESKKSNTSKLDQTTKDILGKTHFNKESAVDFVASTAIEFIDKIEDLADLEDKIDELLIYFEDTPSKKTSAELANKILEYADSIQLLVSFDHLAFGLVTLAKAIDNIKEEQMTAKEVEKFTTLTLHLLHDLSNWRKNIFIKQEANDIHYLDSSLLSSCLQIEAIFEKEKIEEDDDDFELF